MTQAERSYHMHAGKLEFLALKWSVCDHFRDYLFYAPNFVASHQSWNIETSLSRFGPACITSKVSSFSLERTAQQHGPFGS